MMKSIKWLKKLKLIVKLMKREKKKQILKTDVPDYAMLSPFIRFQPEQGVLL